MYNHATSPGVPGDVTKFVIFVLSGNVVEWVVEMLKRAVVTEPGGVDVVIIMFDVIGDVVVNIVVVSEAELVVKSGRPINDPCVVILVVVLFSGLVVRTFISEVVGKVVDSIVVDSALFVDFFEIEGFVVIPAVLVLDVVVFVKGMLFAVVVGNSKFVVFCIPVATSAVVVTGLPVPREPFVDAVTAGAVVFSVVTIDSLVVLILK